MRNYQKMPGPNGRLQWSEDDMRRAILRVRKNQLPLRNAAEQFGVPKSSLHRRLKQENPTVMQPVGRPRTLSSGEESVLVDSLIICSEWGFPLTCLDIQNCVQQYLTGTNQVDSRFVNNRPSRDWVNSFLQRHPVLTKRLATNIKRCRAAVSAETVNQYFDNVEKELAAVPSGAIVNCDETNLRDDPSAKIVIARRGSRHVETIMDSSKQSTSIIAAVSDTGIVLPFYFVYQAKYVYPTWIENGPKHTVYNATESGWFNMIIFEDWFVKTALPYFKKFGPNQKKAIIRDNLGAHLSIKVIQLCEENNIAFLLLPANATHFLQPLDVAWFGPMKKEWRKVLRDHKEFYPGVVKKVVFPSLLSKCVDALGERCSKNAVAGFKACGLVPPDRNQALKRYKHLQLTPDKTLSEGEVCSTWTDVLVNHLRETRGNVTANVTKRGKPFEAGKSITKMSKKQLSHPPSCKKRKVVQDQDNETEEELLEQILNDSVGTNSHRRESNKENIDPTVSVSSPTSQIIKEKDFVVLDCGKDLCLGRVNDITDEKYEIDCMRKHVGAKETYCTYPNVPDVVIVRIEKILCSVKTLDLRRNRVKVNDLQYPINRFL
ncbi:LOW QUALITY PROTEIN: Jerky protein homolog-like [Frankliniella fusca]|uniref:Jerky protein homolog-like n=1 Tax=Frankliniella fusca TaxID=407009 RepID=A0AAE1HYP9_9NEOP|nr:LOW QUALITY PROTEIN: Jerky protein homolog-like [Frankliniella fusca]